jgi:formylglycine-generating enzyme required for sulfatase activity
MPFDKGYKIAHQALGAFQYAFEQGILHRDIKPGNIIIDEGGNCKLMDFGIARMTSTASHDTAASMLSVHYVPPERLDRSREVDIRSDIYSLGLVLYEIFAGRRPFNATETSQVMFAHLNEIPEPPEKFSPALPRQISEAIQKALRKNPEDRFRDFAELKRAIEIGTEELDNALTLMDSDEYLEKTIALAEAAGSQTPRTQGRQRRPPPTGLIVVLVILLVVAGGAVGYLARNPVSQSPAREKETPSLEGAVAPHLRRVAAPSAGPPPVPGAEKNDKGYWQVLHPKDGAVMVYIPPGPFQMGSEDYDSEKPLQTIELDAFYIDKFPVTNAKFAQFVKATGYRTDAEKKGAGLVRIGRRWKWVEGADWKRPDGILSIEGRDDHPVCQLSFNDARAYCRWAGKDLPTEAQWEKAARGPEGSRFPWGDEEPDTTMANFDHIRGRTSPVGAYEKGQSIYGVFGMAGNVYQWCRDWYGTGERASRDPRGPAEGEERVTKGGSFTEGVESIRAANRDRYAPDYSSFLFGARCVSEDDPVP